MKTITAIHGVPRSGTSWLGQIFNSNPAVTFRFQPFFAYKFRDRLSTESSVENIELYFQELFDSDDYFVNMQDPDLHKNYPKFAKNQESPNLVFKNVHFHYLLPTLLNNNKQIKLILIVRNPLAVMYSWVRSPR